MSTRELSPLVLSKSVSRLGAGNTGPFAATAGSTSDRGGLWLSFADFESATGWERKPQGLCLRETCVPIPPGKQWINEPAGRIDLAAFAEHLGQPVADATNGVWAFGPATAPAVPGRVEAPDFTLPDLDGQMHSLADYRGKKVLLYCWRSAPQES